MRNYLLIAIVVLCVAFPLNAASAQETYPLDTITVIGTGSASGSPDIANIQIGVETINSDISEAFSEANTTIEEVISAMTEAGVDREDIRTSGLNIFSQQPPGESNQPVEYRVTNQVHVTVRDLSNVEEVINAAVEAGANNIFGFNLAIEDRASLESEARSAAVEDARQRAEEMANLLDVELGGVLVANEGGAEGGSPFIAQSEAFGMGGSGGAVVETGQLTVNMQVQLTYQIIREN